MRQSKTPDVDLDEVVRQIGLMDHGAGLIVFDMEEVTSRNQNFRTAFGREVSTNDFNDLAAGEDIGMSFIPLLTSLFVWKREKV